MNLALAGKTALITGGTHGIGLAIARTLAREGVDVAVCSRTATRVEQARALLEPTGVRVMAMAADVMQPTDMEDLKRRVIEAFGTLHILVNNVGGGGRWGKDTVQDTGEEVWAEVYEKNALTAIRLTNWAIPHMLAQGFGRVVNITSIFGREGGGRPWFSMAKTAQTSHMKSLALRHDLSSHGLTFNSVAPGAIMIPNTGWETEARDHPERFARFVAAECPREQLGAPEDVANLVAFLCSDLASHINGASIPVDGGQSRSLL